MARRQKFWWGAWGLGLLAAAWVLWPLGAQLSPRVREVELEARGVRFNGTNPPIILRAGERVRIRVHNGEPNGTGHDFVLAGLSLRTGVIAPGKSAVLEFKAERPGRYLYTCSLHPRQMDGELVVLPR